MVQKFAQWNAAGYIWGDTATNTEQTGTQLIDSGIVFGEFVATEFGNDIDGYSAAAANYPVKYYKLGNGLISTSAVTIWSTFVPATSEAPEAALAFLNALYTDADLMNLIDYGVEGKNYVVNENGEADYPEGADPETCGYHTNDWIIGNSFILHPWAGQGADFRNDAKADLESSVVSPYMGFVFDTSTVTDLIANLSSVFEEYGNGMICGLYTEDGLDEFMTKLESAGLRDYMASIQEQLDAWAA